ncbi:hypothetical protein BSL84_34320 [Streptomyces sp. TN58]|nr:hypothetical protein BSL84_00185 [Streptomyces sp. TN58]APU44025.1 hypothetical protein BSL84_34320 [Streptomyces sp. TN58]
MHRRPHRPQGHRVIRTTRPPPEGDRAGHVWLTGYRRLNHRYERHPRNYLAFLGLAAAICCYKQFLRLTA